MRNLEFEKSEQKDRGKNMFSRRVKYNVNEENIFIEAKHTCIICNCT